MTGLHWATRAGDRAINVRMCYEWEDSAHVDSLVYEGGLVSTRVVWSCPCGPPIHDRLLHISSHHLRVPACTRRQPSLQWTRWTNIPLYESLIIHRHQSACLWRTGNVQTVWHSFNGREASRYVGMPLGAWSGSCDLLLKFWDRRCALSAKAFTVSAPSIWNSLSYKCRSSELLSTFKRTLKTQLFDIAYSEREHSA